MAETTRPRRRHRAGLSRIALACERCREKKNKCDGASPVCSQCQRAGAECIVVDRLTHRPLPRGHVDALERENEELRRRIQMLEQHSSALNGVHGVTTPLSPPPVPVPDDGTPSDVSLERTALHHTTAGGDMYLGDSGGTFFGTLVQKTLMRSGYQQENGPIHSSLRLNLNNQAEANKAAFTSPSGRIDETWLPPELIFRLEDAFFDHRWPNAPFLHRPTFRERHLQEFLTQREDASSVSIFLALMVCAMGAVYLERQDRSLKNLSLLCFAMAMDQHFDAVIRKGGLKAIQALLLLSTFALNRSCGINAWQVAGQAVRSSIAMGLHRQYGAASESSSFLHKEMRKRIFWCAYAIDRNISIALGRPPAIRDADIDVDLPVCTTDDDLVSSEASANTSQRRLPTPNDTSSFIHIVELRRLRARIQDTLYPAKVSLHEAAYVSIRSSMHKDLETWAANAPRYNQAKVLTFQTNEWFQITYSQSLLLLYRPSPACPVASQDALQICSENAINLITSYSSLYAKNKMAYTWITLHSLLMASITMLYTLWVSSPIREQTTPAVVDSNIKQCLMLFEVMQETWPLAARCHDIVQRFGKAALGLWQDHRNQEQPPPITSSGSGAADHEIGADYAAWFGVQTNSAAPQSGLGIVDAQEAPSLLESGDATGGLDLINGLDDSIFQDFDINLPLMMDAFSDHAGWH
ncbi:hypothetical protein M409DRAFT_23318 [Zasmidium cellare ATCC 36951]|uniref:Zn(2)-C6 fungal-type domain-containing protein n=1 Tax=Zasmidium cellare ATCC 36951 TaxID=1080233 RepID=A0A6A6CKG0_ZASCE|nr:uncharacterized protein M409DRAFT_23318 [Zasmidium cellare ATCC 36951]KAF2166688.1 hypothetical protein M409DRAFT_23318 [Zasmidium cellare ATCC 36951]